MNNPVMQATNLFHSYKSASRALDGLTFKVPKGSVYALLGRNGSGKSTLVKSLFGLLRPDGGSCEVLGLDPIQGAFDVRSRVGYVPQDSEFDPQMTIQQTLDFIAPFFSGRWDAHRVTKDLYRFGLSGLKASKINSLSGGQRQRLALVAAMAIEPEILILDEPTVGLDAVVRRDFTEMLIEFMAQEGRTLLVSSHLLNEVERLADHVGIIESGSMLLETSVEHLKQCFRSINLQSSKESSLYWYDRLPNLLTQRRIGERWQFLVYAENEATLQEAVKTLEKEGAQDVSSGESDLETLFVDLVEADQSPFGYKRIQQVATNMEIAEK